MSKKRAFARTIAVWVATVDSSRTSLARRDPGARLRDHEGADDHAVGRNGTAAAQEASGSR
jgi:hypothetical protein